MYYDLSLLPTSTIDLHHLLLSLKASSYHAAAIDHEFTDCLVSPPPPSFNTLLLQQESTSSSHSSSLSRVKLYSRATAII